MLNPYVKKNESNEIDQDNKQDKETKYHKDDQNTNNIFDKKRSTKIIMRVKLVSLTIRTIHTMTKYGDKLDQDHNESQASIIDNKDDPYNDKIWILQYVKESKSKESDIVDSSSTLTLLPPWRNLNVTLSCEF